MEPISIALICAAVIGTVAILGAFIRQLLLSRDKLLNDEAQSRALAQEVSELEKMRSQMQSSKRFDAHYQVLGANKAAIMYMDTKIEEILHKKAELVERYALVSIKESGSIVSGAISAERKAACDRLRKEIDREIAFYDSELKQLQERRSTLWDTHSDFQKYLLTQEKSRNSSLDSVYKQHSALLEKVYLRHIDDTEIVAVKSIEASTTSFKDLIMVPIQFLMQFFGVSPGISLVQTRVEHAARVEVQQVQREINDPIPDHDDVEHHHDAKPKKDKKHKDEPKAEPVEEKEHEDDKTALTYD